MPSTNGHSPKRAILYARVSTDEQARSGYSLAQQSEALREYAAREGYEVLEEVADPGQSGADLERPRGTGGEAGPTRRNPRHGRAEPGDARSTSGAARATQAGQGYPVGVVREHGARSPERLAPEERRQVYKMLKA